MVLSVGRIFAMRSHLLSVAALALLSVFVAVSTPCHAAGDEAGNQSNVVDPIHFPPHSDPAQPAAPPDDAADALATIEEPVDVESVPPSEE